ncbi:ATP-grasp domain-containing protein [Polymorphospora rubra]|uniref:ATP-grasp domain-containing protein n=1 Tax=Polymorphospora rubra TaxID=338584 RepID=UPI0033D405AE
MIQSELPLKAARDSRVAFVTCAELPDLDPDDRPAYDALVRRGVVVDMVSWDADVDWAGYDLAVLRSPWDYVPRRAEFVAWAATVPRLANPADVVVWNTDKRYLRELAAGGVPVVPTTWLEPADTWSPPTTGEYVVKPAVSAGSRDTGRYLLDDAGHRRLAAAHAARLGAAGRLTMVQPYLSAVDTAGEAALVFLGGPGGLTFSHSIRKGAMLTGPDLGGEELYKEENISARTATTAELAVAARVLDLVPGGPDRLLYARVDLIPDADGSPLLVELELTEPSLFFPYADGAAERFADAVAARLG